MALELYTREDLKFVKSLVDRNTLQEDVFRLTQLNEEQIYGIFRELRKRYYYRVFEGTSICEPTFCNYQEYMKQNNFHDKIFTPDNTLSVIFSADAHLGHKKDCIEKDRNYFEMMFEFAEENKIRHIINLGDIVEGVDYSVNHPGKSGELKIEATREAQIEYMMKYLPPFGKFTFHFLAGNHDMYSSNNVVYDAVKEFIEVSGRKDITICGYELADLPINDDYVRLMHRYAKNRYKKNDPYFQFSGGSHISKIKCVEKKYHRSYVPPMSKIVHFKKSEVYEREVDFYSGFIVVEFFFSSYGKIIAAHTKYYRFDDSYSKPICFSSEEHELKGSSRVRK